MKKIFLDSFVLALSYAAAFSLLQIFLSRAGIIHRVPAVEQLHTWDVGFYSAISRNGYVINELSSGFFPLFPLLWRLVGSGILAGVMLNITLFAGGFGLLNVVYPQPLAHRLLWLSIPAVFFMFVPYAEATFFFFSSLTIYAIARQRKGLLFVALVLLSMSRATVIVLLPAMVMMQLTGSDRKDWLRELIYAVKWLVAPMLLGLALFICYQYASTGVWFLYFKVQSTVWGHVFSYPKFPMINYGDAQQRTLWINALAVFVGLFGFARCLIIAWNWLARDLKEDRLQTLSCAYVALVTFTVFFFNPSIDGHTLCIGINRYIFASPFFLVILATEIKKLQLDGWWKWLVVILSANACWMAFGAYTHIQELLFYNLNTGLIIAYLLYFNKQRAGVGYALFAFNVFIQIMCYQQFITPLYPD